MRKKIITVLLVSAASSLTLLGCTSASNSTQLSAAESSMGESTVSTASSSEEISTEKDYSKYIKDSFSGEGWDAQNDFYAYMRENVWNDASLSNAEKIEIMKLNFDNMTASQQKDFNLLGDSRVITNPDHSDWGAGNSENYSPDVAWPEFPGLDPTSENNPPSGAVAPDTSEVHIPEHLDRIGSPYGNNFGIVIDGRHCTQDERATVYVENPNARNDYHFEGTHYKEVIDIIKDFDLDSAEESIDKLNGIISKNNELNVTDLPLLDSTNDDDIGNILNMKDFYDAFQNDCRDFCEKYGLDSTYGLIGAANKWEIDGELICNGGGGQVNTPINVRSLEMLGIVVNNGGW